MPVTTLTDLTIPSSNPMDGRQVTYIDKTLKAFAVEPAKTVHDAAGGEPNALWRHAWIRT